MSPPSSPRLRHSTFGATLDFIEALCDASSGLTAFATVSLLLYTRPGPPACIPVTSANEAQADCLVLQATFRQTLPIAAVNSKAAQLVCPHAVNRNRRQQSNRAELYVGKSIKSLFC